MNNQINNINSVKKNQLKKMEQVNCMGDQKDLLKKD